MSDSLVNTIVGLGAMGAIGAALYSPWVRRSKLWTVTVTPLASIIGSGFLISAPLLYASFGRLALVALVLINGAAIGIGLAIRHNIQHFDPTRAEMMREHRSLNVLGRSSSLVLSLAYVVSVAFYVSLLSAFALSALGVQSHLRVRLMSTAVLFIIGAVGLRRGLHGLEALEKIAVNTKMAIIGGLLIVLVLFQFRGAASAPLPSPTLGLHELRLLGGLLLITQGFETTKYMGAEYAIKPRLRALLLSQILALVVYVAFVGLVKPLVGGVDATSETAIVAVIATLSVPLGVALSAGAVFSQFSAAVADTVGAAGIVQQEVSSTAVGKKSYPAIAIAAVVVLWSLDIFAVMAFASRAFATYYGLQCVIATMTTVGRPASRMRTAKLIAFPALAVVGFAIALFAIPAE